MVIDSSALVAIILREPEADRFESAIRADPICLISTSTVLECEVVLRKRVGSQAVEKLDQLIKDVGMAVVPFDRDQLGWARHAVVNYGKGRHPAQLNFGDCFSYALAKSTGEPLLFKGGDFAHTDVASV